MRNLISVAVILHVAFTAAGLKLDGKEVEFGDIIAYEPQCKAGFITYQHYAIYVGDKYPGQGKTFERLKDQPSCVFSPINESRHPYVFNYLDTYEDGKAFPKGTETEMKERIKQKHANCGPYNVFDNNCEHLATYVRYGQNISLQWNLVAGKFLCILRPAAKDIRKHMKKLDSQNNGASSSG